MSYGWMEGLKNDNVVLLIKIFLITDHQQVLFLIRSSHECVNTMTWRKDINTGLRGGSGYKAISRRFYNEKHFFTSGKCSGESPCFPFSSLQGQTFN